LRGKFNFDIATCGEYDGVVNIITNIEDPVKSLRAFNPHIV